MIFAQEGIQHQVVKVAGLFQIVQEKTVIPCTGGAEVICGAAYGYHQAVVSNVPLRYHFFSGLVMDGRDKHFFPASVQTRHAAELEFIMVSAGVSPVVDLVGIGIQ